MSAQTTGLHDHGVREATLNGVRSPRPDVRTLSVQLRRVIRTAPYESVEIEEHMEAAPDPGFTSRQNLAVMRRLLTAEIDAACGELAATHKER